MPPPSQYAPPPLVNMPPLVNTAGVSELGVHSTSNTRPVGLYPIPSASANGTASC